MNVNPKPKLEISKRPIADQNGRIWPEANTQFVPCAKAELNSKESEAFMIETYRSDRRWITAERLTQSSQMQGEPDRLRAKDASETNTSSNQASYPDWKLIALVTFAVFTWAAFAFCLYDIWTKCRGS